MDARWEGGLARLCLVARCGTIAGHRRRILLGPAATRDAAQLLWLRTVRWCHGQRLGAYWHERVEQPGTIELGDGPFTVGDPIREVAIAIRQSIT